MEFENHKSIFLQIADNICERIVKKELVPGDKIASVREMAGEMGVNHNTIMRAYTELQMKGVIDMRRGIGNFVTDQSMNIIMNERKRDFFDKALPEIKRQAKLLGISNKELTEHLCKN